jgi:hypothetical protein
VVAAVGLAGCVTETAVVSSKPVSPEELEVRARALDFATNAAFAQLIAEDCPTLGYSPRTEAALIETLITQSVDLLDGDLPRTVSIFESLERQSEAQLLAQAEPKLLAFIKANDYLPGSAASACRVGQQELRKRSIIGQLLVPQ